MWYGTLIQDLENLADELGLDAASSLRLREFVLAKAKEQYKEGNRSGIRWARTNSVTGKIV